MVPEYPSALLNLLVINNGNPCGLSSAGGTSAPIPSTCEITCANSATIIG